MVQSPPPVAEPPEPAPLLDDEHLLIAQGQEQSLGHVRTIDLDLYFLPLFEIALFFRALIRQKESLAVAAGLASKAKASVGCNQGCISIVKKIVALRLLGEKFGAELIEPSLHVRQRINLQL